MPIVRTLKDNEAGAYMITASYNRREVFRKDLLESLNTNPLPEVLPITANITPKLSNLKISLKGLYSVEVRLQDPMSSSESLMLLKGIIDSFNSIMEYGIPANYLVMNLDRVFIKPDGNISWITWANENQNNENSLLDLLYTISGLLKPRSQSDEKFIKTYSSLFEQDLESNEMYLDNVLQFIAKQYVALEKKIIKEYQQKGHSIETPGGTNEKVEHYKNIISEKDSIIGNISEELQTSNAKLAELSKRTQSKDVKIKDLEHELEELKAQKATQIVQQPVVQQVQLQYETPVDNFSQQPAFRTAQAQQVTQYEDTKPIEEGKKPKSITEDLVSSLYSEDEDDEFSIDDGTTILGDEEEETFTLHLITKEGTDIEISEPSSLLGKSKNNDIVLRDKAVSGRHAKLTFDTETGQAFITDLGSTNGTFVNNERLATNVNVLIRNNTMLRVGRTDFTIKITEGV